MNITDAMEIVYIVALVAACVLLAFGTNGD